MADRGPAGASGPHLQGRTLRLPGRPAAASERVVRLQVGGRGYDFADTPAGDFQIKGLAAGAALPPVLAQGLVHPARPEARSPLFVDVLYLALALIIMGVGFLKANISSIVGKLYPQGDPRRDPGFTLYYYGVNLGAFWAAILCGYLGQTYGWSGASAWPGSACWPATSPSCSASRCCRATASRPIRLRLARPLVGPAQPRVADLSRRRSPAWPRSGCWCSTTARGRRRWVSAGSPPSAYVGHFMVTKCGKVERERLLARLRADRRVDRLLHPVRTGGDLAQPVRRPQHPARR